MLCAWLGVLVFSLCRSDTLRKDLDFSRANYQGGDLRNSGVPRFGPRLECARHVEADCVLRTSVLTLHPLMINTAARRYPHDMTGRGLPEICIGAACAVRRGYWVLLVLAAPNNAESLLKSEQCDVGQQESNKRNRGIPEGAIAVSSS